MMPGMVVHAGNPSYLGGWGRKITWTWKTEVAVSQDCEIALQLGWQEWNSVWKKPKNKKQILYLDFKGNAEMSKQFWGYWSRMNVCCMWNRHRFYGLGHNVCVLQNLSWNLNHKVILLGGMFGWNWVINGIDAFIKELEETNKSPLPFYLPLCEHTATRYHLWNIPWALNMP